MLQICTLSVAYNSKYKEHKLCNITYCVIPFHQYILLKEILFHSTDWHPEAFWSKRIVPLDHSEWRRHWGFPAYSWTFDGALQCQTWWSSHAREEGNSWSYKNHVGRAHVLVWCSLTLIQESDMIFLLFSLSLLTLTCFFFRILFMYRYYHTNCKIFKKTQVFPTWFLHYFFPTYLYYHSQKRGRAQGIARHTFAEQVKMTEKNIEILNTLLGKFYGVFQVLLL